MKDLDLRPFLGLQREKYLELVKEKNRREILNRELMAEFIDFENRLLKKGDQMYDTYKIVPFDEYCPKCKYAKRDEHLDPCNECLDYPAREGSEVPEKFEEAGIK